MSAFILPILFFCDYYFVVFVFCHICTLFCLYFVPFYFVAFLLFHICNYSFYICPICFLSFCILSHLYCGAFVFCCICISAHSNKYGHFVFCCVCILVFWHFVTFVFCFDFIFFCILSIQKNLSEIFPSSFVILV